MLSRYLFLLLIVFSSIASAQTCSNLGQNPATAFPVCGSSVFNQNTVAICGNRIVPTPCLNNQSIFQDKNPYWYKFTAFSSGLLNFLITPRNLSDDYDWQLFDVTGHDPNDVFVDRSLFVACNWSGESGKTGANTSGTSYINCEGNGVPTTSKSPQLAEGHTYLLLVSHFTNSQSGYTLDFAGTTAGITNTTPPRLKSAVASCNGASAVIRLNKNMKCSSLSADGSDFTLLGSSATVNSALSPQCRSGFNTDSVVLTFSSPLPNGDYTIVSKKGRDSNTLLDNCDVPVPENDTVHFTVLQNQPVTIDSIEAVGCRPTQLTFTLSAPVNCNSVAADGSDFLITGPSTVTIQKATVNCSSGKTTSVSLLLAQPVVAGGNYQLHLQKGSDGNTLLNECSIESAAETRQFNMYDSVLANFGYTIRNGCKADTAYFAYGGKAPQHVWVMNSSDTLFTASALYRHVLPGDQFLKLFVSNGVCKDSTMATYRLESKLAAYFSGPLSICPNDVVLFKDSSAGPVASWKWNFGNGSTSVLQQPPGQTYSFSAASPTYKISLVVKDNRNCYDTAYKTLKALSSCFIAVPTAFTPNSDNKNDYLYPVNGFKARDIKFKVYNRLGQLVFFSNDSYKKWDGTINGEPQQSGTFVWTLEYTLIDTGQFFSLKGTTLLIR